MPPRYAYWTIIVDNQPTAFRSAAVEELIPTFNRLKSKQPSAILKWFQDGKLWDSRLDAREAQQRRGEAGRRHDKRQPVAGDARAASGKLEWKPKTPGEARERPKLDWSPRETPAGARPEKRARPPFKPPFKSGGSHRDSGPRHGKPREKREGPKLEWSPRGTPAESRPEKRARQPFKSREGDAKPRDAKWRPGGEHRDPRQKYKDAKKAKWTRFKQTIRNRRSPRKP